MSQATQMITVRLNGEQRAFAENTTLISLLSQLSIPKEKVAVELNMEIIPKERLEATVLKAGDEIEGVHFVGGGAVPKKKKEGYG